MMERVVQRTVFPVEPGLGALYYRFTEPSDGPLLHPEFPDRWSVQLRRGSRLSTDTYFNTLFEGHWRQFTRIARLRLRLVVHGAGAVRLVRRSPLSGLVVLGSLNFDDSRGELVLDVPEPKLHRREAGLLHFEVAAHSERLVLHKAEWVAEATASTPVKLVIGSCTFNREQSVLANVAALVADPAVAAVVERIVVVDQGSRPVRRHPAYRDLLAAAREKLHLVEQDNFGGAGGFTRSILEAQRTPGATHLLLMDDDVIVEPESVFRSAAFLAVAAPDHAVGGPMLDMLRPLELFEAGGWVDLAWLRAETPVSRRRVDAAESLEALTEPIYTHYNAWWFFAFPLHLVERLGLPLPLFIRGDDAEFGYRLLQGGAPTVTLPGLGVWHQPPYLKKDGWHTYYDFRSMLVLAAVHQPSGWCAARAFLLKLGKRLLHLEYLHGAFLCEAVDDFCRGPALLDAHPQSVHTKIMALQQKYVPELIPRTRRLAAAGLPTVRFSKPRLALHLLRCALRQVLRRSPRPDAAPQLLYPEGEAGWSALGMADVVAVDGWRPDHYAVLRRSRMGFLRLLGRGLCSAWRMFWGYRRTAASWQTAFPRLTSPAFWNGYLATGRETSRHDAAA